MLAVGAGSLTTWGLLLGVAALLAVWGQTRRRGMGGAPRRTVPLGGGQALHVVELEGRRLVIGTGPGSAPRLLTELGPQVDGPRPGGPREGEGRGA
jgi:hypothetical protein